MQSGQMTAAAPLVKDLVLIGGGHSHALVLKRWGMKPIKGVRLTVINPAATAPYTGMLPGFIAGHYEREALDIDLVKLCRFAGASLVIGRAVQLDRVQKQIKAETPEGGQRILPYDLAAIDIGITSNMPSLPGFMEHGIAAKPLDRFALRWEEFVKNAQEFQKRDPCVNVIGGGVGGVELALAMSYRLKKQGLKPDIRIIDQAPLILSQISFSARQQMLKLLAAENIKVLTNTSIVEVQRHQISLDNEETLRSDLTVGAAGAKPQGWLKQTGLPLTEGYITVGPTLQSIKDPDIFASGDCAHLSHAPRPKAGVFAVREAPILYHNIRARLTSYPMKPFQPQRDYLKLISLGKQAALAEKFGMTWQGPWLWHLKDRIDRAFMDKLTEFPRPEPAPLPKEPYADGVREALGDGQPLCGGCGAKVGPQALSAALKNLTPTRPDVIQGAGDDAAIVKIGNRLQVITTDHLRAFTNDPWMMGAIAANHALSDVLAMGAAPQVVVANLTLPAMSPSLQSRTIEAILEGAQSVLTQAGADLVGGHTTVGSELTVGFTVTGLLTEQAIKTSGAKPGDRLILTKPIGTGVLLAAEMALKARGQDLLNCFKYMLQPSDKASIILDSAHAMTDVTGFGLAGHLLSMMSASKTAAILDLAQIPLLEGALALSNNGVRSTLFAANQAHTLGAFQAGRTKESDGQADPRRALLYDPQTSGGLLAAVAADRAEVMLTSLKEAGYEAALIGTVIAQHPAEPLIQLS